MTSDVAVRALIRDTDAYEDHPACIAAKRDLATRLQGRPPVLQQWHPPSLAAALVVRVLLQFRGKGLIIGGCMCAAVFEIFRAYQEGHSRLLALAKCCRLRAQVRAG